MIRLFLFIIIVFAHIRSQEDLIYQTPPEEILKLVDERLYTNLFFKTESLENDLKKFLITQMAKKLNLKSGICGLLILLKKA